MTSEASIRRRFQEPGSIGAQAYPTTYEKSTVGCDPSRRYWGYWSWLVVSLAIFVLFVTNAVFWFVGSGAAHDCGDAPPLPTALLTADEYASCVLKNDLVCQRQRTSEAAGAVAILGAVVFISHWYVFQYRYFSPADTAVYTRLNHVERVYLSKSVLSNCIFNMLLILLHAVFFITLVLGDNPRKITSNRCGNREAPTIAVLSFATVVLLFLHSYCVWCYISNAVPTWFYGSGGGNTVVTDVYGPDGAYAQNADIVDVPYGGAAYASQTRGDATVTVYSSGPSAGTTAVLVPPSYI